MHAYLTHTLDPKAFYGDFKYLIIVLTFYASKAFKKTTAKIICWPPHSKIQVYEYQQYYLQMTRICQSQYVKFTRQRMLFIIYHFKRDNKN
jgi:hypothetical protein